MSYLINFDPLIKTEYSEKFDEIRKGLVVQSYYKYGKASRNFVSGNVDAIGSLKNASQNLKKPEILNIWQTQLITVCSDICFHRGKSFLNIRILVNLLELTVCL